MYEIWLVINILWELALGAAPWLLAALAVWTALMVVASQRGADWRAGLPGAVTVAVVVAVAAFLWVPGATRSSLRELTYWVDWANLVAVALGFAGAAVLLAWPVFAMQRGRR